MSHIFCVRVEHEVPTINYNISRYIVYRTGDTNIVIIILSRRKRLPAGIPAGDEFRVLYAKEKKSTYYFVPSSRDSGAR